MPELKTVNMIDPATGETHAVPDDQVAQALHSQWTLETEEGTTRRLGAEVTRETYGGVAGKVNAALLGAARTVSGGLSDVAIGAAAGQSGIDDLNALREVNPGASLVGEIGGAFLPTGLGGLASKAGAGVAKLGAGAGTLGKIAAKTAGGVVEGGLFGAGSATSELALSDDPLTLEHAASVYRSNVLFGGGIGGAAAGLTKSAEIGLGRAKKLIDTVAEGHAARGAIPADLATLDRAGLRAAEKTELEAIEAARVPQRQQLADDLSGFRREVKEQNHFLTTKDVKLPAEGGKLGTSEIGSIARKANQRLDSILNDPVGVVTKPAVREQAATALRLQENAWTKTLEREPELRAAFAADTTGARAAALDSIPAALEKNRALQQRIAEIGAAPASERLNHIASAVDQLASGGGKKTIAEQMLSGTAFGLGAGAVYAAADQTGLPGAALLAPFAGAAAARFVGERVFGRMGAAMGEAAQRSQRAVGAFLDVAKRVAPAAPVLATKVLSGVRYAEQHGEEPPQPRAPHSRLASAYRARSDEIRSQVVPGPTGAPVMRPEARAQLANRISAVAAVNPKFADQLETNAVRRLEYLASKLPMRPELAGVQTGPDRWQPSDMEMRTFARHVAAVEDPHGVIERLAAGSLTPEDADAMRAVYPEMMADITRQIVQELPALRKQLPYQRRLALSIFSGVPVDPAMDPRVLSVLQAQFEVDVKPPAPQAQFGSVKSGELGTPSQQREQGATR